MTKYVLLEPTIHVDEKYPVRVAKKRVSAIDVLTVKQPDNFVQQLIADAIENDPECGGGNG